MTRAMERTDSEIHSSPLNYNDPGHGEDSEIHSSPLSYHDPCHGEDRQ